MSPNGSSFHLADQNKISLRKVLNAKHFPTITWVLCCLIYAIAIGAMKKHPEVTYSDSGLMAIQAQQFAESGFQSFAYRYFFQMADETLEFFPYRKPFFDSNGNQLYIVFPPYYPGLVGLLSYFIGVWGWIIPGYVCLCALGALMLRWARDFEISRPLSAFLQLLIFFGSGLGMYAFLLHESIPAVLFFVLGVYTAWEMSQKASRKYALYAAISFGISFYLRIDLVLPTAIFSLGFLIMNRSTILGNQQNRRAWIYFVVGGIFSGLSLLLLNQWIHGHPLGLRYVLNATSILDSRWEIIRELLFSLRRGLFAQSPFLWFVLFLPVFIYRSFDRSERVLYVCSLVALAGILITAPNHGSHLAPRYLFCLLPIFSLLLVSELDLLPYHLSKVQGGLLFATIAILFLISFGQLTSNVRWLIRADEHVYQVNQRVLQSAPKIVVSNGYGLPLNLQTIYPQKEILFTDTSNEQRLFEKMKSERVSGFIYVFEDGSRPPTTVPEYQKIHESEFKGVHVWVFEAKP